MVNRQLNTYITNKIQINIVAIFIGSNNSLGYKTGKQYSLNIDYKDDLISINSKHVNLCLYSSLKKLTDNWKILNFK